MIKFKCKTLSLNYQNKVFVGVWLCFVVLTGSDSFVCLFVFYLEAVNDWTTIDPTHVGLRCLQNGNRPVKLACSQEIFLAAVLLSRTDSPVCPPPHLLSVSLRSQSGIPTLSSVEFGCCQFGICIVPF